jgi:hypothetical protein
MLSAMVLKVEATADCVAIWVLVPLLVLSLRSLPHAAVGAGRQSSFPPGRHPSSVL